MAQGDVLLNADGTVALNGAGLVRLVDVDSDCPDCCGSCTASATSCTHCDAGTTPAQMQVTLSGIIACCIDPTGSNGYKLDVTNINSIHTLDQQPSGCKWGKFVASNTEDSSLWSAGLPCSGAPDSTGTNAAYSIYLDRTAAGWELEVIARINGINADLIMFKGSVLETVDGDCITVDSISNNYESGDCNTKASDLGLTNGTGFSDIISGYDGTATGVCV